MTSYISSAILVSSMLFSFASASAPEKAVTFECELQPIAGADEGHFTLSVKMNIKRGWHICAEPGEGAEVKTSIDLELPEGAKAKGSWDRPESIEGIELDSQFYVGNVNFSKSVVVEPNAYGKNIEVVVSYQACNDQYCNRPQTKKITVAIPESGPTEPSLFESPVRLTADGKLMNSVRGVRFPSPGIFDVDGDGRDELIIGSLTGSVGVYKDLNESGKGDPVWGPRGQFENADGKRIRTSNW